MKPFFILSIVLLFLIYTSTSKQYRVEFSGNSAEHPLAQRDTMWHPHLKKTWIDNDKFIIEDKIKSIPASLEMLQLKMRNNAFLIKSNPGPNPKLSCGCKFIKEMSEKKDNAIDKLLTETKTDTLENNISEKVNDAIKKSDVDSSATMKRKLQPFETSNFLQINDNSIPTKPQNQYFSKSNLSTRSFQKIGNTLQQINKSNSENQLYQTGSGQHHPQINIESILQYLKKNEEMIQNLKSLLTFQSNINAQNSISPFSPLHGAINMEENLKYRNLPNSVSSQQFYKPAVNTIQQRSGPEVGQENFFEHFISNSGPGKVFVPEISFDK